MKIVVIFGSPHENGITAKTLNIFLNSISAKKDISFFSAYEIAAKPCTDCGFCKNHFECKFRDLDDFYKSLADCDLLICAFPIYNASLPSPMKSLFDRMQPFYFARKKFLFKKRACIVITVQGTGEKDYNFIINGQIEPNLKLLNIKNLYFFNVKNADNDNFDIDKFCLKSKNEIDNIIYKVYNRFDYH